MTSAAASLRRLTHVELLYRPGERETAAQVLRLLGCKTVDRGGTWFTSFVDPDADPDYANNVFYASEVSPEQWRFEQTLGVSGAAEKSSPEHMSYVQFLRREPQRSAHFGFCVQDRTAFDVLAAKVAAAGSEGELKGRVAVDGSYEPGGPGSVAPNMVQMFVWTDVVACGLLTLGQHIEVQWQLPPAD